jgi:hypothetical protein
MDSVEDEYAVASWTGSSVDLDADERKASQAEDEWIQATRNNNTSEVLWLGTQPADIEEI